MKRLEVLKLVMAQNGMILRSGETAASLEIIPLGNELFNPDGTLEQDQPSQPPAQEGGSCDTCAPGCQKCSCCGTGCDGGCGAGCTHGIL